MFKVIVLIKRQPHLTHEEFAEKWRADGTIEYWRTLHGKEGDPGIMENVVRFAQNFPRLDLLPAGTPGGYDGIVEIWYKSEEAMKASIDNEYYRNILRPDELKYIDLSASAKFILEENVVVDHEAGIV